MKQELYLAAERSIAETRREQKCVHNIRIDLECRGCGRPELTPEQRHARTLEHACDLTADKANNVYYAGKRLLQLIDLAGSDAQSDRVFAQFEFDELRVALDQYEKLMKG
jgi:hypothetical protein